MMARAILAGSPDLASRPGDIVRAILAFARDPMERSVEPGRIPRTQADISPAETEMLETALLGLSSEPLPDYLAAADSSVRDAFHRHMQFKAEAMKAWWLVAAPPASPARWLKEHPAQCSPSAREILSTDWKDHPLVRNRLAQIEREEGSRAVNIP